MQNQKLSSLQLELLNMYSFNPKQEDLLAVRSFLAKYFYDTLLKNVGRGIEEKGITENDLILDISDEEYKKLQRLPAQPQGEPDVIGWPARAACCSKRSGKQSKSRT